MTENKKNEEDIESENDVIKWEIKEETSPNRSKRWYILAGIVGCLLIIYALATANFIFAIILVMGAILLLITDEKKALAMEIELSDDGVRVGKEFYEYEQFNDFFIVYKPKEGVKNLYLEFKHFTRPRVLEGNKPGRQEWMLWLINIARTRLSVPLDNINPILVRRNLLKYMKEDIERTNVPLSETLSGMLKF